MSGGTPKIRDLLLLGVLAVLTACTPVTLAGTAVTTSASVAGTAVTTTGRVAGGVAGLAF
jgi:hypothetical protein